MRCKFTLKRIFAVILVTVLLLNCVGFQAFATDLEFICVNETESNLSDPLYFPETTTSGEGFSFFGVMPEISEDREVNWIDRIHNKPDYAVDFYNWLVENETDSGALVSAHEETLTDSTGSYYYVHKINSFNNRVDFNFTPGMTSDQVKSLARSMVTDKIDDDFYTTAEWISEVYCAFDRDHPEVFWLSGGTVIGYKIKYTYGYNLQYGVGYIKYVQDVYFYLHNDDFDIRSTAYCSHSHSNVTKICTEAKTAIKNAITQQNTAIDSIVKLVVGKSDLEKVKFINKYLTENNYYNTYSNTNKYSPLAHRSISALTSGNGVYAPVCDGYARAFKVLCDNMNIPCVLVDGISDSGAHMWNYVQIDDKWYAVDVTWNDPITSTTAKKSGYENDKYLLIGSESVIEGKKFSDSHIVRDTVIDGGIAFTNEPLISKSSYNANVNHLCTLKNGYCTYCYSKKYDVNRDTNIDVFDLMYLKNALLDSSINGNLDCDESGNANSIDYLALKQYFWNQF